MNDKEFKQKIERVRDNWTDAIELCEDIRLRLVAIGNFYLEEFEIKRKGLLKVRTQFESPHHIFYYTFGPFIRGVMPTEIEIYQEYRTLKSKEEVGSIRFSVSLKQLMDRNSWIDIIKVEKERITEKEQKSILDKEENEKGYLRKLMKKYPEVNKEGK